ncbi:hypothetical protein J2Z84_000778 [Agrobacterium rubi]|nr:hypothetical protein [Agrobacterium rubi]
MHTRRHRRVTKQNPHRPAPFKTAGRGIRHVRQMREALADYGLGLGICRTHYNCTSRYLSERPVPCLASGKRWVHGNGSFVKQPLVDTGLRTAGMPRVAPLCFESTGIMREGWRPWRKKIEKFFYFLWGPDWRPLGAEASAFSVMPGLTRHPAAPRLRCEKVFRDQRLDRTGPRLKAGVTAF